MGAQQLRDFAADRLRPKIGSVAGVRSRWGNLRTRWRYRGAGADAAPGRPVTAPAPSELALPSPCRRSAQRRQLQQCSGCCRWPPSAVFTVPPTLQSFGEVVAQEFERPESRALPTFVSVEAGNATPKTAFRSLELAVPTPSGPSPPSAERSVCAAKQSTVSKRRS